MSTTLPGIFSFRVKMAKILGLKLVQSAAFKRRQQKRDATRDTDAVHRGESGHACVDGQNKRDDDDVM